MVLSGNFQILVVVGGLLAVSGGSCLFLLFFAGSWALLVIIGVS